VCRKLDGLPLAIELIAPHVKSFSLSFLLQHLEQPLEVFDSGPNDLPERQRTLSAALDWSYDLLEPAAARLFERLSVFVGGWSLEAAERVCAAPKGEEAFDPLHTLGALVNQSLVVEAVEGSDERYHFLETLREYSRARLAASGETSRLREAHARYFLTFAEQIASPIEGPDQIVWLDRLERDYANLETALDWFESNGSPAELLRFAQSLWWFWFRYGHFRAGRRRFEKALSYFDSGAPSRPVANGLHSLGWIKFVEGDWLGAAELYRKSLAVFREIGDHLGESMSLSDLGVTERFMGRTAIGTRHVEEAVRIAREVHEPHRLCFALIWAYSTTEGKFAGKAPLPELEEAREIALKIGDSWAFAHALNGLGDLYRETGNFTAARLHYEESLRRYRALKERWMVAWNLEGLGQTSRLEE